MGLGNPGTHYEGTRHNAGFECLDKMASEFGVSFKKPFFSPFRYAKYVTALSDCFLIKPLTFMNRSGEIIPTIRRKWDFHPSCLVCICDTLDLPPGSIRIKQGGGSAGHRGLSSVIQYCESPDFLRVYIGIGRPGKKEKVAEYVLERPSPGEANDFFKGIALASGACIELIKTGPQEVMARYNRTLKKEDKGNDQ